MCLIVSDNISASIRNVEDGLNLTCVVKISGLHI